MRHLLPLAVIPVLLAAACVPGPLPRGTDTPAPAPVSSATPAPTVTHTPTATLSPTPQPRQALTVLGPDQGNFPPGVNPLTGRAVSDPGLLNLPAMLISISNSPVTARPQAGPAFADWVFELFIGTGTTRFLGVFYGEYPRQVPNLAGGCSPRSEILNPQGAWLGNRVWLDENGNSRQDDWEQGLGGVCVRLLDAATGSLLAETSTDSNGVFGFETPAGADSLQIHFEKPKNLAFVTPNLGDEDTDSDADPLSGFTAAFRPAATDAAWDAGLRLLTPPALEEGRVQPIRSGRLTYATINEMFPFSCLAFAGAGRGIFEQLEACRVVYGSDSDDVNDGILTVSEMRELAEGNLTFRPVNYSGHLFDPVPPPGGLSATSLLAYYHPFNQARWEYDPLLGSYLRWIDFQDDSGRFTPALDAQTGRQLAFENVIVLYARHDIFRHLQYDIDIKPGQEGYAFLFRDGQLYKIRWSTGNRAWEQQTGLIRPIHFIGADKKEFPLKPGRTFIHIMTEFSAVSELDLGAWRAFFVVPNDPAPGG